MYCQVMRPIHLYLVCDNFHLVTEQMSEKEYMPRKDKLIFKSLQKKVADPQSVLTAVAEAKHWLLFLLCLRSS